MGWVGGWVGGELKAQSRGLGQEERRPGYHWWPTAAHLQLPACSLQLPVCSRLPAAAHGRPRHWCRCLWQMEEEGTGGARGVGTGGPRGVGTRGRGTSEDVHQCITVSRVTAVTASPADSLTCPLPALARPTHAAPAPRAKPGRFPVRCLTRAVLRASPPRPPRQEASAPPAG